MIKIFYKIDELIKRNKKINLRKIDNPTHEFYEDINNCGICIHNIHNAFDEPNFSCEKHKLKQHYKPIDGDDLVICDDFINEDKILDDINYFTEKILKILLRRRVYDKREHEFYRKIQEAYDSLYKLNRYGIRK